ncbi:hypothetical protein PMAYCL1PPCAC_25251, partial [Pristionchus mayeri]
LKILAFNSPMFNAMFYGDFAEKNKKEIELNDVDRKEFIELLHLIYPSNKSTYGTAHKAIFILKLADQFQIMSVIERAERSLIDNRNLPIPEMVEIADQYNLYALKKHCFAKLTTTAAVKVIEKSPVYSGLSDKMKAAIMQRKAKIESRNDENRKRKRENSADSDSSVDNEFLN